MDRNSGRFAHADPVSSVWVQREECPGENNEQILKKSTGKDVNVKIDGGKIQIAYKDSKTEIVETTTWPSDLSGDVPKFSAGKIQRVVKSLEQGDSWSFNIYLAGFSGDDVKNYENALKGKGWQTEIMQMGDKGGLP